MQREEGEDTSRLREPDDDHHPDEQSEGRPVDRLDRRVDIERTDEHEDGRADERDLRPMAELERDSEQGDREGGSRNDCHDGASVLRVRLGEYRVVIEDACGSCVGAMGSRPHATLTVPPTPLRRSTAGVHRPRRGEWGEARIAAEAHLRHRGLHEAAVRVAALATLDRHRRKALSTTSWTPRTGSVGVLDGIERDAQGRPAALIVAQGWFGRRRLRVPIEQLAELDHARKRILLAPGAAPIEHKGPVMRLIDLGEVERQEDDTEEVFDDVGWSTEERVRSASPRSSRRNARQH